MISIKDYNNPAALFLFAVWIIGSIYFFVFWGINYGEVVGSLGLLAIALFYGRDRKKDKTDEELDNLMEVNKSKLFK